MKGFTVSMALVDAIPVLLFGAGMLLVAAVFAHPLFLIGAVCATLAGCFKVAWKLILGVSKKDCRWLNKLFVPFMAGGFLLMLLSFILGFKTISWSAVWSEISRLPNLIFFVLWIVFMFAMGWFRKKKFSQENAKANWTAQIINCVGQTLLFLGILCSTVL